MATPIYPDIQTCPRCGAHGEHSPAVRQYTGIGEDRDVSLYDIAWQCFDCGHEWGFEWSVEYVFTFDRIGAHHQPEPIRIPIPVHKLDDDALADVLAEAVYRQVKGRLASREVEVHVNLTERTCYIVVGGFRPAGHGDFHMEATRSG